MIIYFLPEWTGGWGETFRVADNLTAFKRYEYIENKYGDLGVIDDNGQFYILRWRDHGSWKPAIPLRGIDLSGFDEAKKRLQHVVDGLAVLAREGVRLDMVAARHALEARHQPPPPVMSNWDRICAMLLSGCENGAARWEQELMSGNQWGVSCADLDRPRQANLNRTAYERALSEPNSIFANRPDGKGICVSLPIK